MLKEIWHALTCDQAQLSFVGERSNNETKIEPDRRLGMHRSVQLYGATATRTALLTEETDQQAMNCYQKGSILE